MPWWLEVPAVTIALCLDTYIMIFLSTLLHELGHLLTAGLLLGIWGKIQVEISPYGFILGGSTIFDPDSPDVPSDRNAFYLLKRITVSLMGPVFGMAWLYLYSKHNLFLLIFPTSHYYWSYSSFVTLHQMLNQIYNLYPIRYVASNGEVSCTDGYQILEWFLDDMILYRMVSYCHFLIGVQEIIFTVYVLVMSLFLFD